jgi:hypothetical protein
LLARFNVTVPLLTPAVAAALSIPTLMALEVGSSQKTEKIVR